MNARAQLPDIANARLPVNYSAARTALSECHRIDECKEWANKAEALASYAKQAKDETLRKTADRIQARAVRRCGELLKEYDAKGKRTDKPSKGTLTKSKQEAASEAGLSLHQQREAVRVANVEPSLFEQQIESENPPTVTQLAEQGKRKRAEPLIDLQGVAPADFQAATQASGWVRQILSVIAAEKFTPQKVARGFLPNDKSISAFIADLDEMLVWLLEVQRLIQERKQ